MSIGENIKRLRKEKGLTQKQLGILCQPPIDEANIRKYENDKQNPKIETIKKLATALDCEVSDIDESIFVIKLPKYELTPERVEKARLDAEARKLIERLKSGESLTNEEQKKISDYGKRLKEDMENLPKLRESIKNFANAIGEIGENILLSNYRELNTEGQSEARKRVSELTEIPRYTKPDTSPQE